MAATARESDPAKLKELINRGIAILDRDVPMCVIGNYLEAVWKQNLYKRRL